MYQLSGLGATTLLTDKTANYTNTGYTYQDALDCSNATGTAWGALVSAFAPKCFGYSPAAWAEMAQFAPPASAVAPPAVASALSTVPAPLTIDQYNAELNASIAAGSVATKAAVQAGFDSQPTVCASGETLNDAGVCVGTSCTLLGLACWEVAAAAGAVVLLLFLVGGRR